MTRRWEMRRHRDLWWWLFEAIGWVAERIAPGDDVAGEEEEL